MGPLSVPLNDLEGHFHCLKPYNSHVVVVEFIQLRGHKTK